MHVESERKDGKPTVAERLEPYVFEHRTLILAAFLVLTLGFAWIAVGGLKLDTNFTKQLPRDHEYIQTYLDHKADFGGANRLLIAVVAENGDMFTPEFFRALKIATDEVFFIKGVDRARVQSLWTPNTRYTEVVEGGIQAGDVIPSDFQPDAAGLARVKENILKAGIVGRLVANDFSGAMVSAQLLDVDPETGGPIDYIAISRALEQKVRERIQGENLSVAIDVPVSVHMIGFAKVVGDVADGAMSVITFAVVTVLLTLLFVWIYIQSFRIALVPVVSSLVAMVWMLGLLVILGYGVDPLGILVPFIIFAIGTSHGVQKISAVSDAAMAGADSNEAARRTFRLLFLPAIVALLANLVGFITILLIPVQVIQEMAITASLGIGVIILTDLILLPVLVSYVPITDRYRKRVERRQQQLKQVWDKLAGITERGPATVIIAISLVLGVVGFIKGMETPIGDTQAGVPELRPDSRYNLDSDLITSKFQIGTDILNVIVETKADGCIDHTIIDAIDRFAWHMRNVEGVRDVMSLAGVSKVVSAGWSEGSLKWRNLPRDERQLVQAQGYVETSTGLLNRDCSVMPVMLFLADHRAETIERVIAAVKDIPHGEPDARRDLSAGDRQRRRDGGAERGGQGQGVHHPRLGVRGGDADVPAELPLGDRHHPGDRAADPGFDPGLRGHGDRRHRAQGQHAADGGAGRGHRRGLRHLSVQPHAGVPAPRRERARVLPQRAQGHRRGDRVHRHHAGRGRRHLGVLAAQVPGRRRADADLHVRGEHARRHAAAARTWRLAAAAGEVPEAGLTRPGGVPARSRLMSGPRPPGPRTRLLL